MSKYVTVNGQRFRVWHEYPPIPVRRFDYGAVTADADENSPIGWGRTAADAVVDLMEQLEDQ